MANQRPGVVVASRINHSLYLARALAHRGLLSHYWGPVIFEPRSENASRRDLVGARRLAGVADVPLSRLWAAEVVTQGAQRLAPNPWWRHAPGASALDLQVAARLATHQAPAVLHWHTNSFRLTTRLARARGVFLIADHRALHPVEEHPNGSPLRSADIHELLVADLIIVNSTVARRSLETHGVPAARIRVVELGVDDERRAVAGTPLAERPGRLIFVGDIDERKGLSTLVEALPKLGAQISEVAIVGATRDHSLAQRLIEADRRVRLYGPQPREEVLRLMAGSRLLCLPSRSEAFGLVVPEALSVGTPVVVSSGCGAAQLVTSPDIGSVFPAGDAAALAEAVAAVLGRSVLPQLPAASTWEAYEARVQDVYEADVLPALKRRARRG